MCLSANHDQSIDSNGPLSTTRLFPSKGQCGHCTPATWQVYIYNPNSKWYSSTRSVSSGIMGRNWWPLFMQKLQYVYYIPYQQGGACIEKYDDDMM